MGDELDKRLAELASRQHGVVSTRQLQALGLGRNGIAQRAAAGRLHRLHRGVYAVGHLALPRHAPFMAAVLACGEGAVLSHRAAAFLWGVRADPAGRIEVSVVGSGGRARRAGISVHRTTRLRAAERTIHEGVPVTSVARTLLDLADVLHPQALAKAVRQSEVERLFDLRAVAATLAVNPGRRGAPRLRAVLDAYQEPEPTRSSLEVDFLAFCAAHGLPRPLVNARIGEHEVDVLWPQARLVVEVDSHRFHGTRSAFEEDRRRDLALRLLGYAVVRVTARRLRREPRELADALRKLLDAPV